jgi:undecaprenyl-diphosphatase
MLSYFQAIILGALQGITELFPISSLGHTIILPSLFGWKINQSEEFFLIFLVATHFATAIVLFFFFFNDWLKIIRGIFRSIARMKIPEQDTHAKIGWLLIIGTIPAGLLGLLLEKKLKLLFATPYIVAYVLILNGILLYAAELLRRKQTLREPKIESYDDYKIAKLSLWQSFKIGVAQCLALIPGFSRTGSTIAGGLLNNLNHEDSARFSFLLATPIILAAAILKLPELSKSTSAEFGPLIAGVLASAIAAYFSVKFLTNYFKKYTLTTFAVYCVAIGIISVLILHFR